MDLVAGRTDGPPDLFQRRAGVIADLIFRDNTSADLCGERCQRFQGIEKNIQGIPGGIGIFMTAVGFDPGGVFQKTGYLEQFRDIQGTSDFQALQRTADVLRASERNMAFFEQAVQCIVGFRLHMSDLNNVGRRMQIPAELLAHWGAGVSGQLFYDLIKLKSLKSFLIHVCFLRMIK